MLIKYYDKIHPVNKLYIVYFSMDLFGNVLTDYCPNNTKKYKKIWFF